MTTSLLVPNSVEAEEALLGSVILDPAAYRDVAHLVTPASFFIVRNSWVWEAVQRLSARQEGVDYVTLIEELRQQGRLEEIGGAAYVTQLINSTPASIYAETYAHIVARAALRRRLISAATQIARLAHEESKDINEVLNEAESAVLEIGQQRAGSDVSTASSIMAGVLDQVMRAMDTGTAGIPTGFHDIDHLTGGLFPTDFTVIAGRPGMGKTSLLLSLAFHVCGKGHHPLIISKEMTKIQLGTRFAAMDCGSSLHQMRTGTLTPPEFAAFTNSVDKLSRWNFAIEDGSKKHINDIAAIARRAKRDQQIDLLMVDYLGLLEGDGDNRTQQIGHVSRGLKSIARELKIPVLAAAQLSRKCEERQDKHPILSDLRDSGEIEQDADLVWFLYRDEVYDENTDHPNTTDVTIAKHRNGPTGTVRLYFRKELTQLSNLRTKDVDLAGYNVGFDARTVAAPAEAAR